MTLAPRAVIVTRRTELDELIAHHGTRQAAAFFLEARGRDLADVEARHAAQKAALTTVGAAIPIEWRRGQVERSDLDRFLFGPDDVVIVVGQDGLVANVAKYLDGQPVVGINPEPARNPGVLVPHQPDAIGAVVGAVSSGTATVEERTMVEARTDDGQVLVALNEIFIGHPSHQSARYRIQLDDAGETQSSSGLLVGTGTGSTGWCRSCWLERRAGFPLPAPTDRTLSWFVREAWPSPATGTTQTEGLLPDGSRLVVTVESDHLVAFGDGIESDALTLAWGQQVTLARSARTLRSVRPDALRLRR